SAGTYTLSAQDACDTTLSISVTLDSVPDLRVDLGPDVQACDPDSIVLGEGLDISGGAFSPQRRAMFLMAGENGTDVLRSTVLNGPYDTLLTTLPDELEFTAGDFPTRLGYFLAVESQSNGLYRIERQSGDTTRLFDLTPIPGEIITGLTYDDKNERLLITGVESPFASSANLYEVDLTAQTTTLLTALDTRPLWLASDTSGTLYVYDTESNTISSVNSVDGSSTVLGTPNMFPGDLMADADVDPSTGRLYYGMVDGLTGNSLFIYFDVSQGISYPLPGFDSLSTSIAALGIRTSRNTFGYAWSTLEGDPIADSLNATSTLPILGSGLNQYRLQVSDGCGNTRSDTISVAASLGLMVDIQSTHADSFEAQVSGGLPPFDYLWSNGETSAALSNPADGTYQVTVTDAAGCTAEDSLVVAGLAGQLGIEHFQVYPNPSEGLFNVKIKQSQAESMTWMVWDGLGRPVHRRAFKPQVEIESVLDLHLLSKGVYTLEVRTGRGSQFTRLVIS
ncbi:MAG: T9SS type A sorting domain-containing protein, partial [Bacteroidota bacterium]